MNLLMVTIRLNYKTYNLKKISSLFCRTFYSPSVFKNLDNSFSQLSNFGTVVTVIDGIIKIKNMPQAQMGELITFVETKDRGLVLNIEKDFVSAVVLGTEINILPGHSVLKENRLVSVVVSRGLKGHVVNSLGEIIDSPELIIQESLAYDENYIFDDSVVEHIFEDSDWKNTLENFPENTITFLDNTYKTIEAAAPSIMDRVKIVEPLYTGTTIIDAAIPIGKGQRELIIGDRQIGKTTIAVDTILNQSMLTKHYGYCGDSVVTSIYVSIGQKMSSVAYLFYDLLSRDAMDSTIIVASTASEPASLQFLAPYTGCTYGEFFRDSGFHSVVIYDDLSKHAVAYRQMALLLRRPSGREAYPGDIFYIHSRLLERAAATKIGTLTALPIIETQAGDVSAYIPTNIISITDGQIFLENELFYKGVRPAINIALSVSRIGSAAQNAVLKKVSSTLKLDLVQYREVEVFSMFGSDLDESTRLILHRGMRLVELLKQEPNMPIHPLGQAVLIYSGIKGFLDFLSIEKIDMFKQKIINDSLIGLFPFETYDAIAFNMVDDVNILSNYLEAVIADL